MLGKTQLQHAAGALRLREWALGLLANAPPTLPPEANERAWETFLRTERCAHPLRQVLCAARLADRLPSQAREALEARGVAEALTVLRLRHEAVQVGRLLEARGWRGMVLKGGAAVLDGACEVDLMDLDLLVPVHQASELAAALDGAGYRHDDPDFAPGTPNRHEMAARARGLGFVVEPHFDVVPPLGVDHWEGAVPLPYPALVRMAPANQLWHVLLHATLHHAERRGCLRDLVVAAAAVRGCGADELHEVERRCAAHPNGELPARMLRMARAMVAGEPLDLFRREAATAYLVQLWSQRYHPRAALVLALVRTAFALPRGRGEYAGLWYGSHISAIPRRYAGELWLDRVFPAAATLGRAAWRSAHLAAALPPAAWLARTARRLASAP
jgi:hypothetical protein